MVQDGDEQRIPFVTELAPVLLYVDQARGGIASLWLQIDHRGNPSCNENELASTEPCPRASAAKQVKVLVVSCCEQATIRHPDIRVKHGSI
jgi:hypothetical protein